MTAEPVFSPGRMRAWRHVKGVELETLAAAVGVSVAHVRASEYGHPVVDTPTPAMLQAWAPLLGCRPADLCSTTPDHLNEYWRGASKAMGPMSDEDIQAVADVFDRNARRRAAQQQ